MVQGIKFVTTVTRLMERLLEYRCIINDESRENRMICTVNLLVRKTHCSLCRENLDIYENFGFLGFLRQNQSQRNVHSLREQVVHLASGMRELPRSGLHFTLAQ